MVAPWLASLLRIEDGAWLFRIAALDIPFYGLFFIAIALLNGRQQHLAAGVATGCYATVKLAGIAVLAALGPTVEGALVANVVGSAAGLAAATVAIGGRPFVPSLADWRLVLQLALPVSLRGAGVQLLANVGLWVLSALGSAADQAAKGLYVAALSIARIPTVTVYGTTGVLIASVSRADAASKIGAAAVLAPSGRHVPQLRAFPPLPSRHRNKLRNNSKLSASDSARSYLDFLSYEFLRTRVARPECRRST